MAGPGRPRAPGVRALASPAAAAEAISLDESRFGDLYRADLTTSWLALLASVVFFLSVAGIALRLKDPVR